MTRIQELTSKFGQAYRENDINQGKVQSAQIAYQKADEDYEKSRMKLAEAKRLLLEEAQKA